MSEEFTRRNLLLASALAAIGSGVKGVAAAPEENHAGRGIETEGATLNRFAYTPKGAEVTGMFLTREGHFFFNVQHPDRENRWPGYDEGAIGVLRGYNMNNLPRDFESVQLPRNDLQGELVRTAFGRYRVLANGGDDIGGGERLGIPTTPDGTPLDELEGSEYASFGYTPDFNGFVPGAAGEGYLFTNFETTPGMVTRLHLRQRGSGGWEVLDAMNVDFRDVEGTMINCFGTVTPWDTPLTSEENYAHVATRFWNAPNPSEEHWSLGGVEKLAYYLGADPDQEVIADTYPNPYRYGYIVEIASPAEDPAPVKHFTLGRSAHENAVVMPDGRTAYTSSDGTGKGFYKFVADESGDLSAGTLYAARATQQAPAGTAHDRVSFTLEWVELAHGTNAEIESWIAEYDDVTQADYVAGETSYVTQAEVDAWAAGEADDDRVAFLETHAAAEAAGATMEFRKMEGLNVRREARPGEDYLYMAMSNTDATMSDEEGDIQLSGNEWGAVYRLPLGADYDVAEMEPIVTGGPDANICGGCPYDANPESNSNACRSCAFNPTREEEQLGPVSGTANLARSMMLSGQAALDPENTISEPDNLVVMDDGRVIIGEDTGNAGHEYNMIWVFDPGEA